MKVPSGITNNTLRLLKAFGLRKKFPLTLFELKGSNKRDFNNGETVQQFILY